MRCRLGDRNRLVLFSMTSDASTAILLLTSITMPVRRRGLKPAASTWMSYLPIGSSERHRSRGRQLRCAASRPWPFP